MNTTQFARRVAEKHNWGYKLAHEVVFATMDTLRDVLAEGNELQISKVGTFDFVTKGGFEINAKWSPTGKFYLPESYYIRFTPNRYLKDEIKQLEKLPESNDEPEAESEDEE